MSEGVEIYLLLLGKLLSYFLKTRFLKGQETLDDKSL